MDTQIVLNLFTIVYPLYDLSLTLQNKPASLCFPDELKHRGPFLSGTKLAYLATARFKKCGVSEVLLY